MRVLGFTGTQLATNSHKLGVLSPTDQAKFAADPTPRPAPLGPTGLPTKVNNPALVRALPRTRRVYPTHFTVGATRLRDKQASANRPEQTFAFSERSDRYVAASCRSLNSKPEEQISRHSVGRNRPTGDFHIPEFSAPKLRVGVAHRQAAQYVDAAQKRYSRFVENRLHAP